VNLYGPTDDERFWSCRREIAGLLDERALVESIGGPIANTQIYILDVHGQVVPIGGDGGVVHRR